MEHEKKMERTRQRFQEMNAIAAIVREKGEMSFGAAVCYLGLAPSSMYAFSKMFNDLFEDVKYQNGRFVLIKKEPEKEKEPEPEVT